MTAAAREKPEIGRVVRPSFDEQQGDSGATALRAVRQIADLLSEEVIPRLSDATDDGETGLGGIERAPGEEVPDDVPHADGIVPQTVLAALAELQQVLSAESASALGALFRTATKSRADGREEKGARLASVSDHDRKLAGRPVKVLPGVRIGPVGKQLVRILEHYPKKAEIAITSGYRPERGSHHGGLVYRGSPTAAIDIGGGGLNPIGSRRMRDVAKWLYNQFAADTVELIHTTPYTTDAGFYVKNQRKYPGGGPYDKQTRQQHRNHVHFATSKHLAQKILARLGKPRSQTRHSAGDAGMA
jgi:hypothetical protein